MDVLAGVELFKEQNTDFAAYREGFEVETPETMWPDLGIGKSVSTGSSTGYALMSYFGKINYSFAERYLVSATVVMTVLPVSVRTTASVLSLPSHSDGA